MHCAFHAGTPADRLYDFSPKKWCPAVSEQDLATCRCQLYDRRIWGWQISDCLLCVEASDNELAAKRLVVHAAV